MEFLMWLLLAGRVLLFLVPYLVGATGGLIVLWIIPPPTPTYIKLLIAAAVAVGLTVGANGQPRGK